MIRLFVALELPPDLRLRLASLGGGVPGANWTDEENMHVTLRFIGEVDEAQAADIDDALAGIRAPAVEVRVAGVGHFGDLEKARLLYAGVERSAALSHLQSKVESAVVRAGCPPERRKFAPHVTLARLRGAAPVRLMEFVAAHALLRAEPFTADRFVLFSSFLSRERAIYRAEADYPLA
ncbi:MAG: RNA 2',3'-cyclic phosphodiesterase [Alphaproteobacteria bacterium]